MEIYNSQDAPDEFVQGFIWWARHECPTQQYVRSSCGSLVPILDELSPDCEAKITDQCNEFWGLAKTVIRETKGRCNWHPSVDTDENHVRNCGGDFYFARKGDEFFMNQWPEKERAEFCNLSSKFWPMHLTERDGKLEFTEGSAPSI